MNYAPLKHDLRVGALGRFMAEQNADQAPSRWRAFLGKANAMSGTPAGILAFNHARLLGIISVGAFLAVIVGSIVALSRFVAFSDD